MQEGTIVDEDVQPFYTLADQLYVEPQPNALPDRFELDRPILMSPAEIAVAQSHIHIWKVVAEGDHAYALVLEDDIHFKRNFGSILDTAWMEMTSADQAQPQFDFLYLSYKEVKNGARKKFLSTNLFRPERGLWYFSGYVLSKTGARRLLELLPCRGPIDLWINHQFSKLDVRAVRKSIIGQRCDLTSSNSYSILPSLTKIGVIDSEGAALFQDRPKTQPVFAFSSDESGSSSLAMALSMLGYRCCSNLDKLPSDELESLLTGSSNSIFNAYVNIGCLTQHIRILKANYPQAKFIVTVNQLTRNEAHMYSLLDGLEGADMVQLHSNEQRKWRVVCEHLLCAPPACLYPEIEDLGRQELLDQDSEVMASKTGKILKYDASPWVVEPHPDWSGINSKNPVSQTCGNEARVAFNDPLERIDAERWLLRDDTFPGNLALFRPGNVVVRPDSGIVLTVKEEPLGVRDFRGKSLGSSAGERLLQPRRRRGNV
jgi:GR25 family glycosyltransferase involved in LPS biosynthesis